MKEKILSVIADLASDFVYYDRKESETLTARQLRDAVESGEITVDEMVAEFKSNIDKSFCNGK